MGSYKTPADARSQKGPMVMTRGIRKTFTKEKKSGNIRIMQIRSATQNQRSIPNLYGMAVPVSRDPSFSQSMQLSLIPALLGYGHHPL